MGKRYSDGGINERISFEGVNTVKEASLGIKHNIKIILLLLLIPVIGLGSYFGYKTSLKHQNNNNGNHAVVPAVTDTQEELEEEFVGGYKVLGSVKIEKINLDAKILDPVVNDVKCTDDALRYGVVKIYGDEINEIGNFCMIAHDTNEFVNLDEVIVGDKIVVADEKGEEMNYTVTEIMHVSPEDLTVLLSNEYEAEITLITCEEGATTRFVVKAVNN